MNSNTSSLLRKFLRKLSSSSRTSKSVLSLLFIGILLVVQLFTTEKKEPPVAAPEPYIKGAVSQIGLVTHVVDGDTIEVLIELTPVKVRLIGIDTPETVHPQKPVECFGKEASEKMKELVLGKQVHLESDPSQSTKDKYGRLLMYVYREPDKEFINRTMIEDGFSYEYTYDDPYFYQKEFLEAQKSASEGKKGLWGEETCN